MLTLSKKIKITNVKKRTRGSFLEKTRAGDILTIKVNISRLGINCRGMSYAPRVEIHSNNGEFIQKTFNRMSEFYNVFDFEEVD